MVLGTFFKISQWRREIIRHDLQRDMSIFFNISEVDSCYVLNNIIKRKFSQLGSVLYMVYRSIWSRNCEVRVYKNSWEVLSGSPGFSRTMMEQYWKIDLKEIWGRNYGWSCRSRCKVLCFEMHSKIHKTEYSLWQEGYSTNTYNRMNCPCYTSCPWYSAVSYLH